jgi:uncharacterized protein (DUF1800 family)
MTQAISRREVLQGGDSSFARALRAACVDESPAPVPSLEQHAAQRLTFGPRPGDVEEIVSMGYENWIDWQLNPSGIDDSALAPYLAEVPNAALSETPAQLYARRSQSWPIPDEPRQQVAHATWQRMLHSKRQLYERVVNFWHEHFSINGEQFIVRSLFPMWDSVIRQHALGNFRAMLEATTKNPCMLYYLDNFVNAAGRPNENYARELFELHTLGAENYRADLNTISPFSCPAEYNTDGDAWRDFYIDNDVYEAARGFAGWTFEQDAGSPNAGQYKFVEPNADRFAKIVLCQGMNADPGLEEHGKAVLDILANHPGTARHIAEKLCRRFVSDSPSPGLIASAATVFKNNAAHPNQIRLVLEHIFDSTEFRNARLTKFRRPLEWTAAAMRVLGIPYVTHSSFSLSWMYDPMGQRMFGWRPPDGPPDTAGYWQNSNGMLLRWNFVYTVASGWWRWDALPDFDYSTDGIMPSDRTTAAEIVDWWSSRLFQRGISGPTRAGLEQFVAEGRSHTLPLPASQISSKVKYLAALCTMTPEFQRF